MDRRAPTVSELVRRAVEICDPDEQSSALASFEEQLEDDDEPVTAVEDLEERLALAAEGADYLVEDAGVSVASAVVFYLAAHHGQAVYERDPDALIRAAVAAQWGDGPPGYVTAWLAGA